MSALLADLHAKGLLEQTLVVVGTEFDCTPRNNNGSATMRLHFVGVRRTCYINTIHLDQSASQHLNTHTPFRMIHDD